MHRVCPCLGERLGLRLNAAVQAPLDRRKHPNAWRRGHASRLGTLKHQFSSLYLVYCLTATRVFCFTSHNERRTTTRVLSRLAEAPSLQVNFFAPISSHHPLRLSSPVIFELYNCNLRVDSEEVMDCTEVRDSLSIDYDL